MEGSGGKTSVSQTDFLGDSRRAGLHLRFQSQKEGKESGFERQIHLECNHLLREKQDFEVNHREVRRRPFSKGLEDIPSRENSSRKWGRSPRIGDLTRNFPPRLSFNGGGKPPFPECGNVPFRIRKWKSLEDFQILEIQFAAAFRNPEFRLIRSEMR